MLRAIWRYLLMMECMYKKWHRTILTVWFPWIEQQFLFQFVVLFIFFYHVVCRLFLISILFLFKFFGYLLIVVVSGESTVS